VERSKARRTFLRTSTKVVLKTNNSKKVLILNLSSQQPKTLNIVLLPPLVISGVKYMTTENTKQDGNLINYQTLDKFTEAAVEHNAGRIFAYGRYGQLNKYEISFADNKRVIHSLFGGTDVGQALINFKEFLSDNQTICDGYVRRGLENKDNIYQFFVPNANYAKTTEIEETIKNGSFESWLNAVENLDPDRTKILYLEKPNVYTVVDACLNNDHNVFKLDGKYPRDFSYVMDCLHANNFFRFVNQTPLLNWHETLKAGLHTIE
jgi:hypothetical protein